MILKIENLIKKFDQTKGISSLSFSVRRGEIVGLLGPNGAGKTTTIHIILGVLESDDGCISIFGEDLKQHRKSIMKQVSFSAGYAQLPGNLTVWQNLHIFGLLYGVKKLKNRIHFLLEEFHLEDLAHTKSGVLSAGEQTRLHLAKALLNSPQLLLLDEPTASLDPNTAQTIRQKIKDYVLSSGAGVLWTSHNMHEVEAVCDRVLFLSHGKILLEGNPRKLPIEYKKKNLEELFIAVANEPGFF
ncbi:MAG: ABC transporter ATP-binding protein [Candidatus Brocadia sp. AMX2]|uniref:ABC-2 type transport system ATP-binding protein n=1 Tax=Candidatus Brocadia sinica JPN1 TaxID=1197129 RepID=A0ABQ0K1E7_9BACT|nr:MULTISPECIES: ABC transporter ATP-binding protein [Brocadia]KXK30765.1 MAG: ABC transporter ATP-binding component [Candidatus Brocadia sinica]MBC6932558.1 ABC transporter ATP-binding protein [Candidatus Brocadia sp.]MBL1168092.1 ABC transporter ATP-binding protein [Candidatus Brocadia sp. AMX1]NOG42674.1 ABC transporter ATP-binding protein [Planctomycetota bacterium]KAA0243976.1 MAG: ABC transporter ATP-binding protein [Candidatus Brocadia sp. AMX2]